MVSTFTPASRAARPIVRGRTAPLEEPLVALLLAAGTGTPTVALAIARLASAGVAVLALAAFAALGLGFFRHDFLLWISVYGPYYGTESSAFLELRSSLLAMAAIAATRALRAQVVRAGVLGAMNAQRCGGLPANAAHKSRGSAGRYCW